MQTRGRLLSFLCAFSIDVRERSERQPPSCWKVCHHNTACLCFVGMKEQLSSIRLCTSAGRRVPIVSNSTSRPGRARGAAPGPAADQIRSGWAKWDTSHWEQQPRALSWAGYSDLLEISNCRIKEWVGRDFKGLLTHNEQGVLPLGQAPHSPIQADIECLISSDGASTTPLCQGLTTLMAKNFFFIPF